MLLLLAVLICLGLIVAAAVGRITWTAAAIACVAVIVVIMLLVPGARADLVR